MKFIPKSITWKETREEILRTIKMERKIERINSPNYPMVIKVNVPILFYWNEDGEFDGIALEFSKGKQPTQNDKIQIFHLLDRLSKFI